MLTRRIEALLRRAEDGRPIEMRQVAALKGLVELSERVAILAQDEIVEEQKKSDEELADLLQRIDDRIVELAISHARRILVATGMSEEEAREAIGDGRC